ncbi:GNAT family N-acetyltransferase [Solibacillus sp. CAU 1738]|uniref:GNAT family N-acetyltransferase n=1 Tax=Solibacillus sp. CAU 1738 TaxID=3140363 RepID=UPI00326081F6
MHIIKITEAKRNNVITFFEEHWGSTEMVISSGIYPCNELDGFYYENESGQIVGLITYIIRDNECEIISLDSIVEGQGIGTKLVAQVEQFAKNSSCNLISLITTNDNLHALKFYQKRYYRIVNVIPNAVQVARKIKPTIPLIGNDGIPLNDELKLLKYL